MAKANDALVPGHVEREGYERVRLKSVVVEGEMIMMTLPMYEHSTKLLYLHRTGRAKPIGPAKANTNLQWVVTDTRRKVVKWGRY